MTMPELDPIGPGIVGILFDYPEDVYIPVVISTDPGKGNMGRFLESLPKDKRVVFPIVVSELLVGMLIRRGFTFNLEPHEGEMVEVYERTASSNLT